MMVCIIFMIISIYRLYYYYCSNIDGASDVLCDGHMVYEYSFLVDLDILSPLVQLVFSFGQLHARYGSLGLFAIVLLG